MSDEYKSKITADPLIQDWSLKPAKSFSMSVYIRHPGIYPIKVRSEAGIEKKELPKISIEADARKDSIYYYESCWLDKNYED